MHVSAVGPHLKYRPDVDGLRAVAVLPVVAFHAFPTAVTGGFVGVDIFFVISGYLITGILLRSLHEDTFSIRGFYARRVRRIFPALIVVLVASFVLGWQLLEPWALKQLGKHIVAGAGFVSNLALWNEVGYFDASADRKPLLHLWSLGVEEQFYIVWPVLLWFLWRNRIPIAWSLAAISIASFVASLILTKEAPSAAFYSPMSRAWELGAGSLLACLHRQARTETIRTRFAQAWLTAAPVLGLALIAATIFTLTRADSFPGWWAAAPVAGACLVILGDPDSFVNRRVLASRPMVWIGLISYPLYLWHWVLLSFARIDAGGEPSPELRLGLVLLSVVLAALTYYAVERPIRFGGVQRWKISGLAAALFGLAVLGGVTFQSGGFTNRFPLFTDALSAFEYDYRTDARLEECWLQKADPVDAYAQTCLPDPASDRPSVFVWGDSHAGRLAPGIDQVYRQDMAIGTMTRSSCPPIISHAFQECVEANEYILNVIRDIQPDTVILYAVWSYYAYDETWPYYTNDEETEDALLRAIVEITEEVAATGVRNIILVGTPPYWEEPLPAIL